jgi:hypothetical protein
MAEGRSDNRPVLLSKKIVTQEVLGDFLRHYSDLQRTYQTKGPKALVNEMEPYIRDSEFQNLVLSQLSKLPDLPAVKSCGSTCLEFSAKGQKSTTLEVVNIYQGDFLLDGEMQLNVDRGASPSDVYHKVDTYFKNLEKSVGFEKIFQNVYYHIVPRAHAGSITTAVIIGLVVLAVVVAIYFIASELMKKAEKTTQKMTKRVDETVNNAKNAGNSLINNAGNTANSVVNNMAAQANNVVDNATVRAGEVGATVNGVIDNAGSQAASVHSAVTNQ